MFFPGKYDGQSLMLFSEIKDDNYYRAFKLVD
ncbi:MAG: BREX protein BrxB domain-containing protein [Lactococcus raffinolactis]